MARLTKLYGSWFTAISTPLDSASARSIGPREEMREGEGEGEGGRRRRGERGGGKYTKI